jgi:hypothetical protein
MPHEAVAFGHYRAYLQPEAVDPLGIASGTRTFIVSLDLEKPCRQQVEFSLGLGVHSWLQTQYDGSRAWLTKYFSKAIVKYDLQEFA